MLRASSVTFIALSLVVACGGADGDSSKGEDIQKTAPVASPTAEAPKAAGHSGKVPIARVKVEPATVTGSLAPGNIRMSTQSHVNEVRGCYTKGLADDPALAGKVVVEFVVDGRGRVTRSVVDSNTLSDSAVGPCIANAVKRWSFPKRGGESTVKSPFVLTSE